jgi:hypothetical protein
MIDIAGHARASRFVLLGSAGHDADNIGLSVPGGEIRAQRPSKGAAFSPKFRDFQRTIPLRFNHLRVNRALRY